MVAEVSETALKNIVSKLHDTHNGHLQGYSLSFYKLPISFSICYLVYFLKILEQGIYFLLEQGTCFLGLTTWFESPWHRFRSCQFSFPHSVSVFQKRH